MWLIGSKVLNIVEARDSLDPFHFEFFDADLFVDQFITTALCRTFCPRCFSDTHCGEFVTAY